ncbi:GNAT family N-acetyltransferase [Solwaraspora sp. WMMD406]|uniref:GNAT family N-acetyltransferase n=1 Tax=Solwaraspora sp. WMMD406 TaxID=3016095 RepID=UPI00241734ED|nr:GNAT family N-acetyltransferase [Solwaraspora sp. WMMD406]MDG4767240.1 GNAT family N-acetyltransferase [Solwaraspora sp. WMMD406]
MLRTSVDIRPVPYTDPVAQDLVRAAMADLGARYGGTGDDTPVDPTDFAPPAGTFLVAYLDDVPVGCAGWRSHGDAGSDAELKRMYVADAARGRGVARTLLGAVERSAAEHGRRRVILECGDKQPEAIALYRSSGYARIPNFGYYRDSPGCLSFGRDL